MMTRPKISIVTPSFNQAAFLRDTLRSVETQRFKDIEHIIVDPGSTDGSIDIIKSYVDRHKYARSIIGKDSSQTNGLNIALAESVGEIICWLNSDDRYFDDAVLADVASTFDEHRNIDVLYGKGCFVSPEGTTIKEAFVHKNAGELPNRFISSIGILQPALFLRRQAFLDAGPLNESMNYSFDYEYWVRLLKSGARFKYFDRLVAQAIIHADAKTMRAREKSLEECVKVGREHFGFAPLQWVTRLVDCRRTGADGIVVSNVAKDDKLAAEGTKEFLRINSSSSAISSILSRVHLRETIPSWDAIRPTIRSDLWLVTTFDSAYFDQGVTMLSGLFKLGHTATPKIVFDLGLTETQRAFLLSLENVFVVDFPRELADLPQWYFEPKNYVYKILAMEHMRRLANPKDVVLWIDAGVYPTQSLDPIVEIIRERGAFFVDHDDRPNWPFYNLTFTSDTCATEMRASIKELAAPHICSCLMGFRSGSELEKIYSEAFKASQKATIALGDKHPPASQRISPLDKNALKEARDRLLSEAQTQPNLGELRKVFGYGGHRQDQSILSILAARYGSPILSTLKFCVGSELSSVASRLNYVSGAFSPEVTPDPDGVHKYSPSITVHHRGTFISFDDLQFQKPEKREAVVLGNGTSLRGFDYSRLNKFATFGMNAAYRHWYAIKWFPDYYACLDPVIGLAHREAISTLVADADKLGIRKFLLRRNLIEQLGDLAHSSKIVDFDSLRRGFRAWRAEPVGTGSHTCAWASLLGYSKIFLLGIDNGYVEAIDRAIEGAAVNSEPETERAMAALKERHALSWRNMAAALGKVEPHIFNASRGSKLGVFPIMSFDDVERGQFTNVLPPPDSTPKDSGVSPGATLSASKTSAAREIARAAADKFESHSLEREIKGQLDECGLVFHVVEGAANPGVMIDVGAHFGGSLRSFAQAGWTVYAFEPDPANREKLLSSHGKRPNVTVSNQAVSDRAGLEVPFYSSSESTGISGLSAFRETHREVARVKTTTLNDVVARHGITKIDFLKIDVEGFEMAVLRGLDFTKIMPEVVLAEYENDKTEAQGYGVHDLCEFLTSLGYTVYVSEWYPIERYGIKHSFRRILRYPCDVPPTSWGNLVAFRTDPEPDKLKAAIRSALDKPITFVGDPPEPATLPGIKPPAQTAPRFIVLSDFTASWKALPGEPLESSEAVFEVDTDAGVAIESDGKLQILGLRQTLSLTPGERIAVRHKGRLAQAHTNSSRRASFLVLARAFDAWNIYLGAFPLGFQPAQANWTERNFVLSADDVLKEMPGAVKVRLTVSHNWIDDPSVGNSGNGRSQSVLFKADLLAETAAAVAIADTKSPRWPIAVGILGAALLIGSAAAAVLALPGGQLRPGLLYPLLLVAAAGLLTSLVSVGILLRQRDLRRRGSKIESMRASLFTISDRNSRGPLRKIAASGLFNEQWYLAQNPDVAQAKVAPLLHYVKHGASEGRLPCPYFDPHWYLTKNPDVARSGVEPLSHYLTHGWRENRDPIPLFNTAWYLLENPDVVASGVEPLTHYVRTGWREGRNPCPLFKSTWYLAQNPDVHRAGLEPLAHYLSAGWREGRSPNPLFKPLWYTEQNPDVAQAGVEPLGHFIGSGWQDGRSPHPAFPRALAEFGLNAKRKLSWNEIEAVFDFMFKNSDALHSVFWPMRDGYDALAAKVAEAEKRLAEIAAAGQIAADRIEAKTGKLQQEVAAKIADSDKRIAEIAAAAKIADSDKRIAEVATAGKALGARIDSLAAKSQADHQNLAASLQGSVTSLGHRLETSLSEVAQRAAELRDDLVDKTQVNEKRIQEVGGQATEGLNSLKVLVDAGRAEQAKLQAIATAVEARALSTATSLSRMNASNAAAARPHTRLLDGPSVERIFNHWLPTFGLSMKKSAIAYFAHRMCLAEDQCDGRFATTIQAMILRLLAMRSLGPAPQIKVLEIGTLFGLGSAFFHMFRGPDIGRVKLTIIDPLSGYYSEGQLDMITGVPITLEILQSNLARLNIPAEDVRILQGQSQDQAIRRQAASSRYDLILIDGDHSREGVRRDYEMYAPLLEPGGIILFDDYDTPEWPEIKDTVDRIMANATGLKWIGDEWRTGIAKSTAERRELRLAPERAEPTRKPKRGQKSRKSR